MSHIMEARKSALNAMGELPDLPPVLISLNDALVDVYTYPPALGVEEQIALAVADRLARTSLTSSAPGFAVVSGVSRLTTTSEARVWHEKLFDSVWARFRSRMPDLVARPAFRTTVSVTRDGEVNAAIY